MNKWFCLNENGQLYFLGVFGSFDHAETMGLAPVWILDQQTANQWFSVLSA